MTPNIAKKHAQLTIAFFTAFFLPLSYLSAYQEHAIPLPSWESSWNSSWESRIPYSEETWTPPETITDSLEPTLILNISPQHYTPATTPQENFAHIHVEQVRMPHYYHAKPITTKHIYLGWPPERFHAFFQPLLQQNKVSEKELFHMYDLYLNEGFLIYLYTFPAFENHILELHNKAQYNRRSAKQLASEMGLKEDSTIRFLATNAEHIKQIRAERARQASSNQVYGSRRRRARSPSQTTAETQRPEQDTRVSQEQAALLAQQEAERIAQEAQHETERLTALRKVAIGEYSSIDIDAICTQAFDMNNDHFFVANSLHTISQNIFEGAQICDYLIMPEVRQHVDDIVNSIPTTDNLYTYAMQVVMVDHVLNDMQHQAVTHAGETPSTFERSRALFAQAVTTFVKQLNPITQFKNKVHSLIDMAQFISTVSVGKWYLSEAEYQARVTGYWETIEAFSPKNLAQLSAEHWVDLGARIAADMVFCAGAARTTVYLKELNAVIKTQQRAAEIAKQFRTAAKNVLEQCPQAVTAEGIILRCAKETQKITDKAKAVLGDGYEQLKNIHKHKINRTREQWEKIRKNYDMKIVWMKDKWLKFNFEHTIGFDLIFNRKGRPIIGGLHYDWMNEIEKSGVLQFICREDLGNGFYKATLHHLGYRIKDCTFFPSYWTEKQVADCIFGVYRKFIKNNPLPPLSSDGKYLIKGPIEGTNLELIMHITKNGEIATAFPILKKSS